jgi:Uri superfamily endonuclease
VISWANPRERSTFYIQERSKEQWHVESIEHSEYMLCGKFISENAPSQRIRTSQPSRSLGCGDCWLRLQAVGGKL